MKEISTSISTFADLVSYGCLYVDKTMYIHRMVTASKGQFFLSRPRRFGKSLTVSTLDALFKGRRDLFKGLYIDSTDYDWKEYPVIHIDFSVLDMSSLKALREDLVQVLQEIASSYGVELKIKRPAGAFRELITKLKSKFGCGVVILIDEYDKPLLDHIGNKKKSEAFQKFLSGFYQVIKGSEPKLRFVLLTGITRFSKVSVFSVLNNLTDISMDERYACMLGYTQKELEENFREWIDFAVEKGVSDDMGSRFDREGLLQELKRWYDGFRFCPGSESVYNPVSVGMFFDQGCIFRSYWFSTATPSYVIALLKLNDIAAIDVEGASMSARSLDTFDVLGLSEPNVGRAKVIQILFQSGYLTISPCVNSYANELLVTFPNYEVECSFLENLFTSYTKDDTANYTLGIRNAAKSGDTAALIEEIKSCISNISYVLHEKSEKYYHSIVMAIMLGAGLDVGMEQTTNIGRIDGVINTANHLYIIEFKLDRTADEAVHQIDEKKYLQKYMVPARSKGKTIHKLGINFSYKDGVKNIYDWKEEIVK